MELNCDSNESVDDGRSCGGRWAHTKATCVDTLTQLAQPTQAGLDMYVVIQFVMIEKKTIKIGGNLSPHSFLNS